ncbi:MAG: Phosphatidylserine decarboxylase Pcd [Candidatus Methanohalarchaeum thermophilum]|uniref:Phosphatidylserine decarboxylase Pcd n=1 Tax=Methanohalarchaeum thermophilum TaxID=1903181 RepID=A0A1Q6DW54_METT1|nr:MAG: Phosphatidylserine decarboxylase Pcd [Candidatus Methanohalarchaeum thermophilum]
MNIAKPGYKWILGSVVINVLLYLLNLEIIFLASIAMTALFIFFFRDPDRTSDLNQKGLISPADGKVIEIKETKNNKLKISIFLSILNVHAVRSPLKGEVISVRHKKGKKIPAFKKESDKNEKNITKVRDNSNNIYSIELIAGFIARRIFMYCSKGDQLAKGQKIGFISFGSRVNLLLPEKYSLEDLSIKEGEKIKAGKTKLVEK